MIKRATTLLALTMPLAASMCVSDGYVLRTMSIDAAPGSVGMTFSFDNMHLPQTGWGCGVCVATGGDDGVE